MVPLVIAHRGASGYRPENTLEAFELGLAQGADGIEFDLVNTLDGVLVIRHENALSETTDVLLHHEFAGMKRQGVIEDKTISDWFTEDFTLAQLKTLRAIERVPDYRPGSALFDNQFEIPTFSELLEDTLIDSKMLVVEIKRGSHLKVLKESIGKLTADAIANSTARKRNVSFVLESFDFGILLDARSNLEARSIPSEYFLALEETPLEIIDLAALASKVNGLSISMSMLFSGDDWVTACHDAGLKIWAYTARAEQAETSIEAYYERIIQTGVDGIFADQPDLLRRVLEDRG